MMRMNKLIEGAVLVVASLWLVSSLASVAHAQDAKQIYEKSCRNCHGSSGKGDGPAGKILKPPPADLATAIKGKSDADIAKVVKEGGKAVGKSAAMPAFGSKLSDDQIQGLVEYMKSFGAK